MFASRADGRVCRFVGSLSGDSPGAESLVQFVYLVPRENTNYFNIVETARFKG